MPTHEDLVAAAAKFVGIHHLDYRDEERAKLVLDFVRKVCGGEEKIVVMSVAARLIGEIQEQNDLDDVEAELAQRGKWGTNANAR